jgi:hypothetical protein
MITTNIKSSSININNIDAKIDKNAKEYEDFNSIIGLKPSLDKGIELNNVTKKPKKTSEKQI